MLNQIVLVGRIYENKYKGFITIAVPRCFKNEEGEYDTDYIKCKVMGQIEKNTKEWTKKGDIVGIKGRIESNEDKSIQIIAEKVTFLSSKKEDENENN